MLKSQLYDPSTDPLRPEFYNEKILRKNTIVTIPNTTIIKIYKSKIWISIKSTACRLLMIFYSMFLIIETAVLFKEYLLFLNVFYLFLILADGFVVIFKRKGLEDRWCCLSIIYFICAISTPFWLMEINHGIFLTLKIYNPDFMLHFDHHYRYLRGSDVILTIGIMKTGEKFDSDNDWLNMSIKEEYSSMLEKHEALFCLTLIICRVFIPQATLTWGAISSLVEFSFNTIFDIYSTINMCRDPRLNLPNNIRIAGVLVSNGALLPISLNIFPDSNSFDGSKISLLRKITDNFYFRLIIQILLADLPFLMLRLVILKNLKYVKKEMYYLIAKQIIIILVKLMVMIHNIITSFSSSNNSREIDLMNNLTKFKIF